MTESLHALDAALSSAWQLAGPWTTAGSRHQVAAIDVCTGAPVSVTAVCCAADGLATASLAREIGALEALAQQPAVQPLLDAGRHDGWLYMVTPALDDVALGALVRSRGPLAPADAVLHVMAVADLLHLAHSLGVAHGGITADAVCLTDGQAILRNFSRTVRVRDDAAGRAVCAGDVFALACVLYKAITGIPWQTGATMPDGVPETLAALLHRALGPNREARYPTAIAFAQALCAVQEQVLVAAGEVTGRDASLEFAPEPPPLSDGADRSMRVLHALLDRAEVSDLSPDPADPLVQRCWDRTMAQVPPDDARLRALQCRWRLLAEQNPLGALAASEPVRHAPAVAPYRARALAAAGRAAEARTLAVRTWFDDDAPDLAALRSLTMALVLTRAFDLASLAGAADCANGVADPVLTAATRLAASHGRGAQFAGDARTRALEAIDGALEDRAPWTAELLVDPRWDDLRADPRFHRLLARAKSRWTS